MYFRIVLGFVSTFFTSKYSFSSGVGYAMRPKLLIMWTAFQIFIMRHNNNNSKIEDLVKEIKRARAEWENIRMAERPPLPNISENRKAELLIKQAN